MPPSPRVLIHEATTELQAARQNLAEVIERLQGADRELQNAILALGAGLTRVRQCEARLRSAEEAT
jgi:exonuclease VII small subunit